MGPTLIKKQWLLYNCNLLHKLNKLGCHLQEEILNLKTNKMPFYENCE